MTKPTRDLLKIILTNFLNSFRPRQIRGNYMGEDYFGNKYYEIPANPSIGKRKPERWFQPIDKEEYNQEVTAEWDAWLRGRRQEPPTREELIKNLQIMEMKKRNAAELDRKHGKNEDNKKDPKEEKGFGSFPRYDEYDDIPSQEKRK